MRSCFSIFPLHWVLQAVIQPLFISTLVRCSSSQLKILCIDCTFLATTLCCITLLSPKKTKLGLSSPAPRAIFIELDQVISTLGIYPRTAPDEAGRIIDFREFSSHDDNGGAMTEPSTTG